MHLKKLKLYQLDELNLIFFEYLKFSLEKRHFTNENLGELSEKLGEIFSNFESHSESKYFYVCGQFFPQKKYFDFCLTDKGIGIARYVMLKERNIKTQSDAVKWAFDARNTTKDTCGGLGLKLLKEFVENKRGQLIVYCNNIIYNVIKNQTKEDISQFFGTSVFVRLPM